MTNIITKDNETLESNKNQEVQIPKKEYEIFVLEEIIDDLRYLTKSYPITAVKAALLKQHEITPFLLEFLTHVLENYERIDDHYFGHLHAMFLLAYFREKEAFPLIIQMASLPGEWPETILGGTITEDLDRIIASVYNGDINLIQQLIENEAANTWSRNAAIRSLIVLMRNNQLERDWIIQYFKKLFNHAISIHDAEMSTHLVSAITRIYPEELYPEIKMAYENYLVDTFLVRMQDIDEILTQEKEKELEKYFYQSSRFNLIDDVIKSMQGWACFRENSTNSKKLKNNEKDYWDFSKNSDEGTYHRESPKIGRNEPCPCGSGKKHKKCCLS